jgi:hypothetical protein
VYTPKNGTVDREKLKNGQALSYYEFSVFADEILQEVFPGPVDNPLNFALARNVFQETQVVRLMALARRTPEHKTARRMEAKWQRMIERMRAKRLHLEKQLEQVKADQNERQKKIAGKG